MKRFVLLLFFLFSSLFVSFSQELLTLENVISVALDKNYAVKIAQSREAIAHNDNTRGNAGMLPFVSGTALQNFTRNSLNQSFFNNIREPLVQSGIDNRNNNAGVTMVWTLYDGMGMFAAADRLKEIEKLGKTNVQITIQNTVAQVSNAYYEIIRQKQRLKALQNALEISATRQELAKANYEVGTTSKSEYLAAQVDYNQDQAAVLAQRQVIQNAEVNLNALLFRDFDTKFSVIDTIVFRKDLSLTDLKQKLSENPNLLAAAQSRMLAKINEKEVKATKYPQVDLVTGYTYTSFNNEAGFGAQKGSARVLNYGARLTIPIYDGYNQRRREQNAKVNTIIAEYQEGDLKNQLFAAIERTYNSYQNSIQLFNFEEQNLKIARQNVDLAFERYKFGNSTAIEFREAQRNAVATESRLIESAFNVKITEIELLRLSSSIVNDVK
jgi:outer membrane protein TolC